MQKYELKDIHKKGLLFSRICELDLDPEKKILSINFTHAELKEGGALIDCTFIITDWWQSTFSLTKGQEAFDIHKLQEIIAQNKVNNSVYELLVEQDHLTLNGDAGDYLFSLNFVKPKVQVTGEYDPD